LTVVPNIWGRIIGALLRIPVIVSGYRSLFPNQHERWLWRLSRRLICNAGALKKIMVERYGVPPQRIAVIPNSVDADHFTPSVADKTDVPTVLYLGRFVPDKDPANVLESFRLVAARHPTARFEMVGDGPLFGRAETFITSHGLARRIRLSHGVEDVRPHLRNAWVLALGSRREASPNVILEAMSTGLPVAATNVGGIPEIVSHGRTGLLVPPADPQGMAEAILTLLEDGDKRSRFGQNARQAALDMHSPDLLVHKTEEVFLEALNFRPV
jgi:glycosyltransferase involved in cell wall biosynthesis